MSLHEVIQKNKNAVIKKFFFIFIKQILVLFVLPLIEHSSGYLTY